MRFRSYTKELFKAVGVALSPKTIHAQWKDLLRSLTPQKTEKIQEPAGEMATVLQMRVRCGDWPKGAGTLITTRRQNFTFGNAEIFDICLCPNTDNGAEVPDVWCSAFYDRTLEGFVFVQATGSFEVHTVKQKGKYIPGDWSLNKGLSHKISIQNNVLIPCCPKDEQEPVRVTFSIGDVYFFEVWAYTIKEEDRETVDSAGKQQSETDTLQSDVTDESENKGDDGA